MTFKETFITLVIMLLIIAMTALFNYTPSENVVADSKIENEENIEAFINELNNEAIIYTNY